MRGEGGGRTPLFLAVEKSYWVEVYERYYCLIYVYDDRALFLRFPGKKEYRFLRIIHFGINLSSGPLLFPAFLIFPHLYTVTNYLFAEREREREREREIAANLIEIILIMFHRG